jgi:hypothetical protein
VKWSVKSNWRYRQLGEPMNMLTTCANMLHLSL